MSNPLYKNKQELLQAITKYLKEEPHPTPRHFRAIGLGVSKSLLSNWKKTNPVFFDLIQNATDLILAAMEQKFTYGGKAMYNIALTLRAYDKDQYAPELRKENIHQDKLPTIIMHKTIPEKGVQSDRQLKKLPKK